MRSRRHEHFHAAHGLDGFESWSAQRGIAALALWPPNADRILAITAVGHALRPGTPRDAQRPALGAADLRAWLASTASGDARSLVPDGFYDAPPLVQSAVAGSRFALLGGLLKDADLMLRIWTDALAATLTAREDDGLRAALRTLLAACAVSDLVIARSGVVGDTSWPDHELAGEIGVPEDEVFERLCAALVLTSRDLGGLGLRAEDIDPLVGRPSAAPTERWRFPLVRDDADGSVLLLASPAELLSAALVRASQQVGSSTLAREFSGKLTERALAVVRGLAGDMDWVVESVTLTGAVLRCDIDKVIAVELAVSPPIAERSPPEVIQLGSALHAALRRLDARREDPETVLGLVAHVGDGRPFAFGMPDPDPAFGPWVTPFASLRLIGDALRRDQLALWRLLADGRPKEFAGAEFGDLVGMMRAAEEMTLAHVVDDRRLDGSEYLHRRARMDAGRHPAPAPPDWQWVTVSRSGGTSDPHVFEREDEPRDGTVLARDSGRFVWVRPCRPLTGPGTVEATLVSMTAFWSARLLSHGWMRRPDADEVAMSVVVEFDDRPGPMLVACTAPGGVRLVAGAAFMHALSRGDNLADRALLLALAHWWLPVAEVTRLVDAVCPAGRGTFIVWSQPHDRELVRGPEPLPVIPSGVRRRVEQHVVGRVGIEADQFTFVPNDAVLRSLDSCIGALLELLEDRLAELRPDAVREFVALHERALVQEQREEITLPARVAMLSTDEVLGEPEASIRRGLALRGLVDRLAARPPQGEAPLSLERATLIRACAETLVEWGASRDALKAGSAHGTLVLSRAYGVVLSADGASVSAVGAQRDQFVASAPERMLEAHERWWTEEPAPDPDLRLDEVIDLPDPLRLALDKAMLQTWGFRWEELLRILRALSDRALRCPDSTDSERADELAAELATRTHIAPSRISAALAQLSLGSCAEYRVLEREHKPWGVNRARSYVRRPLVVLPNGDLAWSAEHVLRTARFLNTLMASNRLNAPEPLRAVVGRVSQANDAAFEREVARRAQAAGWHARHGVNKIGGLRLERVRGEDIGNLDVVAYDPDRSRVWLLEAKRLYPALVPFVLEHETARLEAYATKHEERLTWVRAHPDRLEHELGPPAAGGAWTVAAAIVVDSPLAGAHHGSPSLPIWTIDELAARLT